jgi:hypothetical protein
MDEKGWAYPTTLIIFVAITRPKLIFRSFKYGKYLHFFGWLTNWGLEPKLSAIPPVNQWRSSNLARLRGGKSAKN